MEGNSSPIYIIENQNEKNIDQILDINNENLSEKYNQNESTQNLNMIEPENKSSKECQIPVNKGFVRIFRNIFKKKDNNRKKILENLFIKWRKESLKGLRIKKTIIVRISVSRKKDLKNKYKNKFNFEKEIEKSKSVDKNRIKTFNKNKNKIKREIKNNNIDNKIEKKNYDNKYNNIGYYEIDRNNKGKNDNQALNKKDYSNNNNINNAKIINNESLKSKNKIVEINEEKPKITPKIDKNRNIYPINNPHIQNYKPLNNENNIDLVPTPQKQYNNINIIFTSSTKKTKKDIPNNKNNNIKNVKSVYNLNNNNQNINIQSTNINNESNGYYIKYDRYHKDKKNYVLMTPNQKNLNRQYYNIKNENDLIRNNKRKISDNVDNSSSQVNKTDYNKFKRNTYQINGRTSNNNAKIIEKYKKKDKNYTFSQNTVKPALKSGVTTVVQHYSGRRKQ